MQRTYLDGILARTVLKGRQRWNLVGETIREIGTLQSVFGLMDWVYKESVGTGASFWWVFGFVAVGVAFICIGLWMQFAVGDPNSKHE